MMIEPSRADTEISPQIAICVEQPREAALATSGRSLPMRDIPHVGLPRPLTVTLGDRLAQEVLNPTLREELQW